MQMISFVFFAFLAAVYLVLYLCSRLRGGVRITKWVLLLWLMPIIGLPWFWVP